MKSRLSGLAIALVLFLIGGLVSATPASAADEGPVLTITRTPAGSDDGWHPGPTTLALQWTSDIGLDSASVDLLGALTGHFDVGSDGFVEILNDQPGYTYAYWTATDVVGNVSEGEFFVGIDDDQPMFDSLYPKDGGMYYVGMDVEAYAECSDATSEVITCESVSGERLKPTETGSNFPWTYRVVDSAGNTVEKTIHYSVAHDLADPQITGVVYQGGVPSPTTGWSNSGVLRWTVNAEDTGLGGSSGIAAIETSVNAGAWVSTPVARGGSGAFVTVTDTGILTVRFRARDNAGRTGDFRTMNVKRDIDDPTASITGIDDDGFAQLDSDVPFEFECQDPTSGVATCTATNDGDAVESGDSLDTSTLGAHTIVVSSTDVAGRSSTTTFTYTVVNDPTKPVITSASIDGVQGNDDWYTGTPEIVVQANDGSGDGTSRVRRIQVKFNNDEWTAVKLVAGEARIPVTASGDVSVAVRPVDGVGNIGDERTLNLKRDAADPIIEIDGIADGDRVHPSVPRPVAFECDDASSGVKTCSAEIDGAAFSSGSDLPTSVFGPHSLVVTSTDNSGHTATTELSYTVVSDTTAPSSIARSVDSVQGTPPWYTGETANLQLTSSDEPGGSGLDHFDVRVGTGAWTSYPAVDEVATSIPLTATGTFEVAYKAFDHAGNESEASVATIRRDLVDPTAIVTFTGVASGERVLQNAELTATFDCADADSGVLSCSATAAGAAYTSGAALPTTELGSHNVTVITRDKAGRASTNVATYRVVSTLDADAPIITSATVEGTQNPAGWLTGDAEVVVQAADAPEHESGLKFIQYQVGTGGWIDIVPDAAGEIRIPIEQDGQLTVRVRAVDNAGNTSGSTPVYPKRDTVKPTARISGVVDGGSVLQDSSVTATLVCEDATSRIKSCKATVDGVAFESGSPLPSAEIGEHTIEITAVDKAGHDSKTSLKYTVSATADVANPTITQAEIDGDKNAAGWYLGDAELVVTALDDGVNASGVKFVQYQVGDGDWHDVAPTVRVAPAPVTVRVPVTATGEFDVKVRALDNAGNTSGEKKLSVKRDPSDPDISVTGLVANQSIVVDRSVKVTIAVADAVSGVDSWTAKVDNVAFASGSALPTGVLGNHTLVVTAKDKAGREKVLELPYKVTETPDETVPTVSSWVIRGDKGNGSWYTDTTSILVSASDENGGSGVRSVQAQFTVDGKVGAWESFDVEDDIANVPVSVNGSDITVKLRAVDNAGNVSLVKLDAFKRDAMVPETTIDGVTTGDEILRDTVQALTFSCTDVTSGVQSCDAILDGTTFVSGSRINTAALGEHTLKVTAVDKAGLKTESVIRYTVVLPEDTVKPTVDNVSVTGPVGSADWLTGDATVVVTASDPGTDASGIDKVQARIDEGGWTDYAFANGKADVTVVAAGSFTLEVRAVDKAGNTSDVTSRALKRDAAAPQVTVTGVSEAEVIELGANVPVTFECTDAVSGVGECSARIGSQAFTSGSSIPTAATGAFALVVSGKDVAGNTTTRTVNYTVRSSSADTTIPTVDRLSIDGALGNGWLTGDATAVIAVSDAGQGASGVDFVEVKIGDGAWTRATVADGAARVAISATGQFTLSARVTDKAGNVSTIATLSGKRDTDAPTATAAGIADGANFVVGQAATFSPSCADATSAVTCRVTLDGAEWTPATPLTTTVGSHTLAVTATDAAGHIASASVTYTVTVAPKVASKTVVKLAKKVKATKKAKATIAITEKATQNAKGKVTVTIKLGKKKVKTLKATVSTKNKVVVTLPKLKAGKYTVVVAYAGNTWIDKSTKTVKLTVAK